MIPAHTIRRALRVRAAIVVVGAVGTGVLLDKFLVLFDCHLGVGDGETAGDDLLVGGLIAVTEGLIAWRAHTERRGTLDDGERLSLTVDEPAAFRPMRSMPCWKPTCAGGALNEVNEVRPGLAFMQRS